MDGGGFVLEPLSPGYRGLGGRAPTPDPRTGRAWDDGRRFGGLRTGRGRWFRRPAALANAAARRLPPHLGTGLTLAFFVAVAGYGLTLGGQLTSLRDRVGEPRDIVARMLGFGLDKITISGLSQLGEAEILARAGISPRVSLPFLGAAEIRARLEALPLVRSADVRKLYPHEVAITLVEREPYALWQKNGDLYVVASDGTTLDRLRDQRFAGLPLVVGEGAAERAADYALILAAAGPLKDRIRAGMLISGRRWNLKMANGIDVRLPEQGAPAAVARLARLDREQGLLAKDVLAIDLRLPDRVVVRLSEEAAAAHAEIVKKKPVRGAKGLDT